jgi:hypothetical protein
MPPKLLAEKTGDSITEKTNPEYVALLARDQTLLGYLLSFLTRDVLMGVTTASSVAAAWSALEGMFGFPTRARTVNTHIALATMKKGTATMVEYYSKMKSYTDEMVSSGQPLGNEELIAYILTGMDEECYNPLVSSIVARADLISPPELYSQMLSYEHHVTRQSGSGSHHRSVNAASRGHGTPWPFWGASTWLWSWSIWPWPWLWVAIISSVWRLHQCQQQLQTRPVYGFGRWTEPSSLSGPSETEAHLRHLLVPV